MIETIKNIIKMYIETMKKLFTTDYIKDYAETMNKKYEIEKKKINEEYEKMKNEKE